MKKKSADSIKLFQKSSAQTDVSLKGKEKKEYKFNKQSEETNSFLHLIDDKKQLIEHLFDHEDLNQIIPKSLKGFSIDELKELCYQQLNILSRHKLISILEKDSLDLISKKDDIKKRHNKRKNSDKDGSTSKHIERKDRRAENNETYKLKNQNDNCFLQTSSKQVIKSRKKSKRKDRNLNKDSNGTVEEDQDRTSSIEKTEMEILEMEMRARAIRSLLKLNEQEESNDEDHLQDSGVNKNLDNKLDSPMNKERGQDKKITETFSENSSLCDGELLIGMIGQEDEDSIDRELRANSEDDF